eukprot:s2354_g8.t1
MIHSDHGKSQSLDDVENLKAKRRSGGQEPNIAELLLAILGPKVRFLQLMGLIHSCELHDSTCESPAKTCCCRWQQPAASLALLQSCMERFNVTTCIYAIFGDDPKALRVEPSMAGKEHSNC